MKYESVIGLEIHAQLSTKSKLFCSCSTSFGSKQNTNICPVCTGQPGTLPVLNKRAVQYATRAALAFNCKLHERSIYARKNYFYPDLPKGYQISQYELPLATDGWINISLKNASTKRVGITRIHIEEDAGKNIHEARGSLVDLNRCGIPLVEIVSEPDIRSPEEAVAYFKKLRTILDYIEVCDCNMEEGNLRCDVNISLREFGKTDFGTKVEIKNVNSFRFAEKALSYEIQRQSELISSGKKIIQETRLFDSSKGITKIMREKEESDDYRYFPEPDLLPLQLSDDSIQKQKDNLPEMPDAKRERFIKEYSLSSYNADVLTSDRALSFYYEELTGYVGDSKLCSSWIQTEVMRILNEDNIGIDGFKLNPESLSGLLKLIKNGDINQNTAKVVFSDMIKTDEGADSIVAKKGLLQIQDKELLESIIEEVMKESQTQLKEYRDGKTNIFGYFVGQVMKKTKGKANPALTSELLKIKLSR